MFKCRSAHRTGRGLKLTEEIFAVSAEDRVELHIFNSHDVELNVNFFNNLNFLEQINEAKTC